jgi:ubiquitin thioesterase protein OTUB1
MTNLTTGCTYNDLVALVHESFELHAAFECVLIRLDYRGWGIEIVGENNGDGIPISKLKHGDCIEVREFGIAAISAKLLLENIALQEKCNESLRNKVYDLSNSYEGFRKIRGDGNCYYRAIIFGILEAIIISQDREAFGYLRNILKKVVYAEKDLSYVHSDLLHTLAEAQMGTSWQTIAALEADFLDNNTRIDEGFVRACKKLTAAALMENQDVTMNGLTLRDAVLATYYDVRDMTGFCREYVLKMGVCAEGSHIDLGLLPRVLGCECHLVILSREEHVNVITLQTNTVQGKRLAELHLLFRPGHYDLLYRRGKANMDNHLRNGTQNGVENGHFIGTVGGDGASGPDSVSSHASPYASLGSRKAGRHGHDRIEDIVSQTRRSPPRLVPEYTASHASPRVSARKPIAQKYVNAVSPARSSAQRQSRSSDVDHMKHNRVARSLDGQNMSYNGNLENGHHVRSSPSSRTSSPIQVIRDGFTALNMSVSDSQHANHLGFQQYTRNEHDYSKETAVATLQTVLGIDARTADGIMARCRSVEAAMEFYFANEDMIRERSKKNDKLDKSTLGGKAMQSPGKERANEHAEHSDEVKLSVRTQNFHGLSESQAEHSPVSGLPQMRSRTLNGLHSPADSDLQMQRAPILPSSPSQLTSPSRLRSPAGYKNSELRSSYTRSRDGQQRQEASPVAAQSPSSISQSGELSGVGLLADMTKRHPELGDSRIRGVISKVQSLGFDMGRVIECVLEGYTTSEAVIERCILKDLAVKQQSHANCNVEAAHANASEVHRRMRVVNGKITHKTGNRGAQTPPSGAEMNESSYPKSSQELSPDDRLSVNGYAGMYTRDPLERRLGRRLPSKERAELLGEEERARAVEHSRSRKRASSEPMQLTPTASRDTNHMQNRVTFAKDMDSAGSSGNSKSSLSRKEHPVSAPGTFANTYAVSLAMDDLRYEQQYLPILKEPLVEDMIVRAVMQCEFRMADVLLAITVGHRFNLMAITSFIRCRELNVHEEPTLYKDKNEEEDKVVAALIARMVHDLGYKRLDVIDCLLFDHCRTADDAVDAIESHGQRNSQRRSRRQQREAFGAGKKSNASPYEDPRFTPSSPVNVRSRPQSADTFPGLAGRPVTSSNKAVAQEYIRALSPDSQRRIAADASAHRVNLSQPQSNPPPQRSTSNAGSANTGGKFADFYSSDDDEDKDSVGTQLHTPLHSPRTPGGSSSASQPSESPSGISKYITEFKAALNNRERPQIESSEVARLDGMLKGLKRSDLLERLHRLGEISELDSDLSTKDLRHKLRFLIMSASGLMQF